DMCTPFWVRSRSTVQSMRAEMSFSTPAWRSRIAFSTPVTPARDSPSWTSGAEACRSSSWWRVSVIVAVGSRTVPGGPMNQDTSFPRLVSLACHDLRTPLATVHGFARTLSRRTELAPPADRYMEMIEAAAGQLAELLDELSLAARIESGRYDPN